MSDFTQAHHDLVDGTHRIWFEPPDTIVIVLGGTVTEAAATQFINRLIAVGQSCGYLLLLADLTQFDGIDLNARKAAATIGRQLPRRALAMFGGNFAKRVMLDLVFRASNVLSANDRAIRYFADEQAARSWLASMRSRLR